MQYHHTQIGTVLIAALGAAIVLVFFPSLIGVPIHPMQIAITTILVIALVLLHSLTVEIKENILECHFGPGLISRKIPLSDIVEVSAVRNPWFIGWGIRWNPGKYWLWNVSGLQAVELLFKNGKRFRIGTDEPESLVQAIQNSKALGSSIQ